MYSDRLVRAIVASLLPKRSHTPCLLFAVPKGGVAAEMDFPGETDRAYGKVPRNRGKNTTLIASITLEGGMGKSMTVEGATDALAFETYVEHFLTPSLGEGQVMVLDGLGVHRTQKVSELHEGQGTDLVFLPSYSPELNRIEEPFSKIKHLVRKAGARVREALVGKIAQALAAVTFEDSAGWFAHAGDWPQDQPLFNTYESLSNQGLNFTADTGAPLNPSNLRRRSFAPLLKCANLPNTSVHDLGHTCTTLLPSKGTHPKFVQELLGHATVAITLDTYSHMLPGMGSEAADAIGEALG